MVWPNRNHRAFVSSNAELFDFEGAGQFNLLTLLGLRESHYLLDIGCGSLRAGKLLIPFLQPGHYHGLDPDEKLVRDGLERELGQSVTQLKAPVFSYNDRFEITTIDRRFDYILASSIFSHAASAQILACLKLVSKVLTDSGIFLATFCPGDSSYTGTKWVYPGQVQYRPAHIQSLAEEHRLSARPLEWPHVKQQQWMMFARDKKVLDTYCLDERALLLSERASRRAVSALYQELTNDPAYTWLVRLRALWQEFGFGKRKS